MAAGIPAPDTAPIDPDELNAVFEERAEHLSLEQLSQWTITTPRDKAILAKLRGPGLKLLTGPRGSGKSTLLRQAYYELHGSQTVVVAYVNYARSLRLEPLFHQRPDALKIFRQWLLMKIVDGLAASLEEEGTQIPEGLSSVADQARDLIGALERGDDPPSLERSLAPSQLLSLIDRWISELNKRRCVLLLDDAAHAFSPEQQREFFEVFRELKTRTIAAKAAVYPGVTAYSANFHVGHEAELLEAWYRPDDPGFLPAMHDIVERRLPEHLAARLEGRQDLVDYLALASFGLPRGFIVMLSQLLGVEEKAASGPSRRLAEDAIASHAASVIQVFQSLSAKLPRLKHFVEVGLELQGQMTTALSRFNRDKPADAKAVVVGIREPLGPELHRMLSMLEYAGAVRKLDTVSRGPQRVYHRYMVHFALVITDGALSLGKSFTLGSALTALTSRDSHAFVRTRGEALLGKDFRERCTIDLAPCQYCGAERVSEEARFCMKCGRQLEEVSIYEELLHADLAQLPLTGNKLAGLRKHTAIRTVQDVLLDEESEQLRSVPYLGPIWAARIRGYAEEFVSV